MPDFERQLSNLWPCFSAKPHCVQGNNGQLDVLLVEHAYIQNFVISSKRCLSSGCDSRSRTRFLFLLPCATLTPSGKIGRGAGPTLTGTRSNLPLPKELISEPVHSCRHSDSTLFPVRDSSSRVVWFRPPIHLLDFLRTPRQLTGPTFVRKW